MVAAAVDLMPGFFYLEEGLFLSVYLPVGEHELLRVAGAAQPANAVVEVAPRVGRVAQMLFMEYIGFKPVETWMFRTISLYLDSFSGTKVLKANT